MKTFSLIAEHSKLIKLNNAEVQILEHLVHGTGMSEQEALVQVISYKREQVIVQEKAGQYALCEMLLKEIDEWNDAYADHFDELRAAQKPTPKIFIP